MPSHTSMTYEPSVPSTKCASKIKQYKSKNSSCLISQILLCLLCPEAPLNSFKNGIDVARFAYRRNSCTRFKSAGVRFTELCAYGVSLSSRPLNKHHAVLECP